MNCANRIPFERLRELTGGDERCQVAVQRRCYLRQTEDHVVQLHLLLKGLLVRPRGSRLPPQDTHGKEHSPFNNTII